VIRVTIREARARLSELIRIAQREPVVIVRGASGSRAYRPYAVLIGVEGWRWTEVRELVARVRARGTDEPGGARAPAPTPAATERASASKGVPRGKRRKAHR
jgi:prevent-host-death family protein